MAQPPEGFEPHARKSPLTDPWEPLYAKKAPDRVVLGLTVAPPHTNSRGMLHGGLIAALADNAMGLSCGQVLARDGAQASGLVTVSLGLDYIGKAGIGDWLEFDTDFVRAGRSLCFAGATVTAGGAPIARAHATFRVHTSSSS
jgi:acyl-coenzyme A thioesterase PaaI-like protein